MLCIFLPSHYNVAVFALLLSLLRAVAVHVHGSRPRAPRLLPPAPPRLLPPRGIPSAHEPRGHHAGTHGHAATRQCSSSRWTGPATAAPPAACRRTRRRAKLRPWPRQQRRTRDANSAESARRRDESDTEQWQ
jgi:hypothetical protein